MSGWNILVGFDGSAHAEDALDFGRRLAAATGARLIVGCVYPFRPLTGRLASGDQAQAILAAARPGVPRGFESRIIPASSVADGLRGLADSDGVHIIVLGSRHRGRLGEALPGRNARALIRGGEHLVAVVPRGHREGALRRVGVLADGSAAGRASLSAGQALARDAHAALLVDGLPSPAAGAAATSPEELAGDLASGGLDLVVAPAWPHGLLGRLRRRGRRAPVPGALACPVIIVPAAARLPAGPGPREPQRRDAVRGR